MKILVIIPYVFYPPNYGGALRCFYLLKEMARKNQVTLLTVQPLSDFKSKSIPNFPDNIEIASSAEHAGYKTIFNLLPKRIADAINSRILRRSLLSKGNLYLLNTFPLFKKKLLQNKFDFVCFENLESYSFLLEHVKRLSPNTRIIYDAHNVDSELWKQQANILNIPQLLDNSAGALKQEEKLHKTVDLCFCCSEVDKEKLVVLNNGLLKPVVIPNGVDCSARPFDLNEYKFKMKNILFCGTLDYAPNVEGIIWFYKNVYPLVKTSIPNIKFTIIGKMNTSSQFEILKTDTSVNLIGFVDEVEPYYRDSSILIVPLLSGSGTRLKILESMSLGNPVVSTTIGAEGLQLINGRGLLIADSPSDFAGSIVNILNTPSLFNNIRHVAGELVREKFDWQIIGNKMNNAISTFSK